MQIRRVLIFAVLCVFGFSQSAAADTLVVRYKTSLRARPGETAKVIVRLRPGQSAELLRVSGRWFKVRIGRRTGWLTRTTVKRRRRGKVRKRSRRWGRKTSKRFGRWRDKTEAGPATRSLPRRVVVRLRRANTLKKPRTGAKVAFAVRRGAVLEVLGQSRRGRWYLVQTDDREPVWISSRAVSVDGRAKTRIATTAAPNSTRATLERSAPSVRRPAVDVLRDGLQLGAMLGVNSMSSEFHSNGTSGLGNYDLDTQAGNVMAHVAARLTKGRISLAAFASYRTAYSNPGVHYQPSAGGEGDVTLTSHSLEARAALGAKVTSALGGVKLYGVGGYRYDATLTNSLDNIGMLPNESVKGVVAGARIELGRIARTLAVYASVRALLAGERLQTPGLTDGTSSSVSAVFFRVGATKYVSRRWVFLVHYFYDRAHTSFSGQSSRQADVTEATRIDQGHTLSLGVGRRL